MLMVDSWRERKKLELKQALYRKAIELFESEGYENTTVQQISEAVGVAKGTFFNHFPSKEHVVSEWYNEITARAIRTARAHRHDSAKAAVAALFADMSGQATASPELMIVTSRNNSTPLLLDATRHQISQINHFLIEQCQQGIARGEIEAETDLGFFVALLTAVLSGTSRAWSLTPERFDFPQLISERVHFLFRAVEPVSAKSSP